MNVVLTFANTRRNGAKNTESVLDSTEGDAAIRRFGKQNTYGECVKNMVYHPLNTKRWWICSRTAAKSAILNKKDGDSTWTTTTVQRQ